MATQDRHAEESSSQRTLIIIVAVAAGVLIALFFAFLMRASGPAPEPTLQGAIRPGSPEFDKYKAGLVLDDPEATEAKRALGDIVMSLRTTVRNLTGKTVNGLEIRAAVVDHQGKPVKERTVVVIPGRTAELPANRTMDVPVMLEGMKDSDDRANIKMEITGFKFKE